jgi:hypothetical protein
LRNHLLKLTPSQVLLPITISSRITRSQKTPLTPFIPLTPIIPNDETPDFGPTTGEKTVLPPSAPELTDCFIVFCCTIIDFIEFYPQVLNQGKEISKLNGKMLFGTKICDYGPKSQEKIEKYNHFLKEKIQRSSIDTQGKEKTLQYNLLIQILHQLNRRSTMEKRRKNQF